MPQEPDFSLNCLFKSTCRYNDVHVDESFTLATNICDIMATGVCCYSAATPTGPVRRKLTNRDAIAKFFRKQPITLKQADNNARSKKFDTVTSDHDRSGNYDWFLSILNVLNFEQDIEMSNSQLIIQFSPIKKP